jgi:hypothetical protein
LNVAGVAPNVEARSASRTAWASAAGRFVEGSVQRSPTVATRAPGPPSPVSRTAYSAVTWWPAPIAPASTPSFRYWSSGIARFS